MKIIGSEEHFSTKETLAHFRPPGMVSQQDTGGKVSRMSIGETLSNTQARLRDMDDAGIDMQVLSLGPGVEDYDTAFATALVAETNDELSEVVKKYPSRFAGLASIAPQNPEAAANELERAVIKLGLKGALLRSHSKGEHYDIQKYWVIFERAEILGVPIYIHPREPSPDMIKPYQTYPELTGAMWGFAAEAGLQAMRLICSGVFDKYPNLKIVLGHMGEALPYWMWRMDSKGPGAKSKLKKKASEYVKDNFYLTTSGMFYHPALICAYLALGADNILFAIDYPAESSVEGISFIKAAAICPGDKEKICHLNAEKIFKL